MSGMLSERGSATLFVGVALAVLLAACMAALSVTGLVSGHRRAQSAGDLAALAAASAAAAGRDGCATAARVAAYHHGRLIDCGQTATAVRLTVAIPVAIFFGFAMEMKAEAKAGR